MSHPETRGPGGHRRRHPRRSRHRGQDPRRRKFRQHEPRNSKARVTPPPHRTPCPACLVGLVDVADVTESEGRDPTRDPRETARDRGETAGHLGSLPECLPRSPRSPRSPDLLGYLLDGKECGTLKPDGPQEDHRPQTRSPHWNAEVTQCLHGDGDDRTLRQGVRSE